MMRRRRNRQNFWPLLALPIVGAIGWVISRITGRRSTGVGSAIPVSGSGPAERKSAEGRSQETVRKDAEKEPKFQPAEGQQAETAAPEAVVEPAAGEHELPSEQAQPVLRAGHALENQPESLSTFFILLIPFLILPVAIVIIAFQHLPVQSQSVVPGGDPNRGQAALQAWGCGACHTIPGVTGANGAVGPALTGISDQSYIAGHLQNTPANMIQWIMHPQAYSPGVDMPDAGVPQSVARDMAAYLYSIK